MPLCPNCGAAIADDSTCRAMFDELLAHEYAFPAATSIRETLEKTALR